MARRHSIEVPDWQWKYFQERYALVKPASRIRDAISEWIEQDKLSDNREPVNSDADEPIDRGTVTFAMFNGICSECGKAIHQGDEIVTRTVRDRKLVSHFGHYE